MIYVTGDTHGDFRRFNKQNFPEQEEMTKDDYVVILGDFGGIWTRFEESVSERYWLNWLDEKPFTTLFVDGNHEDYDRLYSYPEKEWHGGIVNEIRPSVLHLKRGQVFDICGKKCFTFGGARSHDIDGGVFEIDDPERKKKEKAAMEKGLFYRINHLTWWKEEEPTQEEMDLGIKTLEANGWKVDFVFTHECPSSLIVELYRWIGKAETYPLSNYLEQVRQQLDYEKWFFGHHHDNRAMNDKDLMLYEQIIRIC